MKLKVYADHGLHIFPEGASYEHDAHRLDIFAEDGGYLATFNQWNHVEFEDEDA